MPCFNPFCFNPPVSAGLRQDRTFCRACAEVWDKDVAEHEQKDQHFMAGQKATQGEQHEFQAQQPQLEEVSLSPNVEGAVLLLFR